MIKKIERNAGHKTLPLGSFSLNSDQFISIIEEVFGGYSNICLTTGDYFDEERYTLVGLDDFKAHKSMIRTPFVLQVFEHEDDENVFRNPIVDMDMKSNFGARVMFRLEFEALAFSLVDRLSAHRAVHRAMINHVVFPGAIIVFFGFCSLIVANLLAIGNEKPWYPVTIVFVGVLALLVSRFVDERCVFYQAKMSFFQKYRERLVLMILGALIALVFSHFESIWSFLRRE